MIQNKIITLKGLTIRKRRVGGIVKRKRNLISKKATIYLPGKYIGNKANVEIYIELNNIGGKK